MGMPNLGELLIILFIVLLVFGAAKMPALGEALGKALFPVRDGAGKRSVPPRPPASGK